MFALLCAIASFVAILGPGIIARAFSTASYSAVWLPVPGTLLMAVFGVLIWKATPRFPPDQVARWELCPMFLVLAVVPLIRPVSTLLSQMEMRVLGFVLLLGAIAMARGTYSIGPTGELYQNGISRTLEGSDRGDSRISYHVVQLVANRLSARSQAADLLFAPWNFSSRGPIAGLAASPLVLCTGARPPSAMVPVVRWTVFDPEGFAAYRVFLTALLAAGLFIPFGLARLFLDEHWSLFAFLCAAAAPFTVHELFFTWPKLAAGSYALLGIYLGFCRRPLAAGFAVGIGYLLHPSALLWFPAVLLVASLRFREDCKPAFRLNYALRSATLGVGGLGIWLVFWWWVNHGVIQQGGFIAYVRSAGGAPPTVMNWLTFRFRLLLDTLVPFWLFLFRPGDPALLPADHQFHRWVYFVQQWWCCLPLGCGLLVSASFVWSVVRGWTRKAGAVLWLLFLPSFILFLVYYGIPVTDLLREGLHAWVLGILVFSPVVWYRSGPLPSGFWRFLRIAFVFRGLELLLVLLPVSAWTRGYILQPPFQVSDFLSLLIMVAGTAGVTFAVVRTCRELQNESLSKSLQPVDTTVPVSSSGRVG